MNPNDLFDLGSSLGRLGVLGLLGLAVIVIGVGFIREWFIPGRAYVRELARAERAIAGWESATKQFERALDVIERLTGDAR